MINLFKKCYFALKENEEVLDPKTPSFILLAPVRDGASGYFMVSSYYSVSTSQGGG